MKTGDLGFDPVVDDCELAAAVVKKQNRIETSIPLKRRKRRLFLMSHTAGSAAFTAIFT